jgi:carboxyl-terminal processing protease
LDKHFGNPSSEKAATKREELVRRDKPLDELRFLRDEPPEKKEAKAEKAKDKPDRDDLEIDDLEGADPDTDEIVEDFQIRFARDLLVAAPLPKRDQMLRAAKGFLAERKKAEARRIDAAISTLGLDWTLPSAKSGGAPKLVAEF